MTSSYRSVFALQGSVFLLMAGAGALTSVLSVHLEGSATKAFVIGAIMTAYFVGLMLGSLFAHRVILRVGHIRAFATFVSLFSACGLAHAIMDHPLAWGLLRLLEGYCMAALAICIESWLNQKAEPSNRGKLLAFYMISMYGGYGMGQTVLMMDAGDGFLLFAVISILLSVALVPVTLTRQIPPALPDIVSYNLRRLYESSPLGVVGVVISGAVTASLYSLGPLYVLRIGHTVADAGLFMSSAILGGMVLQWPLGWLSDIFDRRVVLIALFAALAIVSGGLAAAPGDMTILLAGGAVYGGIIFALYPVCLAHTNDRLDSSEMVAASGGLMLGYSMGAMAGPIGASAAMAVMGAPGLMLFAATVGLGAVLFGIWRVRIRPPVPAEMQASYVAVPRTTPALAPMLDRSDEESPFGDVVEEKPGQAGT